MAYVTRMANLAEQLSLGLEHAWKETSLAEDMPFAEIIRRRLFLSGLSGQKATASSIFESGTRIPRRKSRAGRMTLSSQRACSVLIKVMTPTPS